MTIRKWIIKTLLREGRYAMPSNFYELSDENFLFQNQTERKKNGKEVSDVVQHMETLDNS